MAVPQMPFTWLTTNTWEPPELSVQNPPALQLPARAHDTELIWAYPPWLRATLPGTSMAVPQVPFTLLTTNACGMPELSSSTPPALHLPGEAHDTERVVVKGKFGLSLAVPGTCSAVPHVPPGTAWAAAARRGPAAAPPAALATPAAGPSSTTAAPATTTVRRIRSRIATPHVPDRYCWRLG